VRSLSMAIAATDYEFHRRFLAAASAYRAQFLALMNTELIAYTEANTFDYTRGRELWERIPAFAFEPPDVWSSLSTERVSAAALVIWCAGALAGIGVAVRRMAVA
jgi:ABC-2 type transport system permease protein